MRSSVQVAKNVLGVTHVSAPHWVGDGFHVRSMFAYDDVSMSPFLLLDYGAPKRFEPSQHRRGVGEHPHRGFETVTIAYQGEIEHRDSTGAGGKIGPGDVQWMTAASGIVHEEKHSSDFARRGGTLEMVQLWVNLPAKLKMSKPGYQDIASAKIPTVELPEGAGTARVIAGELLGTKGPARTFTPVNLWDVRLRADATAAGKSVTLNVPDGYTTAVLVLAGEVRTNGSTVGEARLIRFDRSGDSITLEATKDAKVLVLSGEPIDEPVVGYGPFVMNTEDEIRRAFLDYQTGKMGHLD